MSRPLVLIVDDEPDLVELVELTLSRMSLETRAAPDLRTARALLEAQRFDLCLTDMRLPDGDGLDLVAHIQQRHPSLPVAVITAHGNVELAVKALKLGAFDFVSKPLDLNVLRKMVGAALRLPNNEATATLPGGAQGSAARLIGQSPPMRALRELIARVARSQAPVYISGESGTGKELVARLIHESGARRAGPFVPVNCGAIPGELMESELFGHKKGSFTGAIADKKGLVQSAEGGTLFLDEVADLPLHMQVKLLRLIQEKTVRPVGEAQEQPVDVRILSATHKNLAELVAAGRFREDLFYRINVIELRVPALRERLEDLDALVAAIVARLAARLGVPAPQVTGEALERLRGYHFPGNVRELENILERAVTLSIDGRIGASDIELREPPALAVAPATATVVPPAAGRDRPIGEATLPQQLEDVERAAILKALEQTRYNK
ncbi:MAG: sigma-54 dependent transcriptional regulator, partial [Steroidobacteraceae bacterium]|nr:sigma-54 dependent transcriptional regulator [Steroidobacteraceae bacterium]MDW8258628.1 sigma-54 dependent transcriptional regulator [Gammaproteobacteria bacterium]